MTKPAKPYYANPSPSQERRNILNVGCAVFFAGLAGVGIVLTIGWLSQHSIF